MKKNDLALLVLIVAIAVVVSYFVGKSVIGDPNTKAIQVETAQPISDSFPQPDQRVFNDKAIDPAVNITIGGKNSNTNPFSNNSNSQ